MSAAAPGDIGLNRAFIRLSLDTDSLRWLNWKSRFCMRMYPSRPIWTSRWRPGTPQPFVRILEVKSTSKLPTTLPESHAMQIGAQTALLKVCWNQPVFNLVQENGEVIYHKTFPEICNEWLGVRLPDVSACDIQGWILCLSMSDAKVFGPFLPEDTDLARCLAMASEFWATLNELRSNRLNLNDIQTTQGLAPLCPSCSWEKGLPAFQKFLAS